MTYVLSVLACLCPLPRTHTLPCVEPVRRKHVSSVSYLHFSYFLEPWLEKLTVALKISWERAQWPLNFLGKTTVALKSIEKERTGYSFLKI